MQKAVFQCDPVHDFHARLYQQAVQVAQTDWAVQMHQQKGRHSSTAKEVEALPLGLHVTESLTPFHHPWATSPLLRCRHLTVR
jgi:hypothetical protein